ncbi:siderophore-interacting protein [Plantactinospora endophytica]|uniref:Siderophore-interacting protein n=1 Tax=Plantactinospora endophytica TaxID=673535 RepID=A0ABQ4EDB9_9ACTN|nr:siderophore-interacting protein [Plantactinospora endophytica]GIG92707.1 siderophore-interacting protein [Plantactinospora endophytica]
MPESSNRTGVRSATVLRTAWLTPHMIRVVLGGDGLTGFVADTYTDHYVKLIFPPAGVDYPEPVDLDSIKRELARDQWPRLRTYTVRAWDATLGELTLDFVYHGDEGLAGPWAAAARPGDRVMFRGPGGGYAPDPLADWHLLVGDESALPAIGAALERLPHGVPARVFVEVADADEEQHLPTKASAEMVWLHRADRPFGAALVEAVRAATFPDGDVHAFVHGEAYFVRELRRMLRGELRVPKERLSISGYWRCGDDDESWRSAKPEWNRQVEAEESATIG